MLYSRLKVVGGPVQDLHKLEDPLSSRQVKNMRCVAFCRPKAYETTDSAHLSQLNVSSVGRAIAY